MPRKRARQTRWLAVVLFFVGSFLFAIDPRAAMAATGAPLDLDPLWQGVSDEAACASLQLDASKLVALPELVQRSLPGGCVRATVQLEVPAGEPVAVALGRVRAAWEVYANGVRIGAEGDLATGRDARTHFGLVLRVPEEALRPDGRLTIAMRWRMPAELHWFGWRLPWARGVRLAGAAPLVEAAVATDEATGTSETAGHMVVATVFALLGAFHLVLFYKRRQLREYLYFSISMLAFAGWDIYEVAFGRVLAVSAVERFSALAYIVIIFGIEGTWALLRSGKVPKTVRGLQIVLGVLCVAQLLFFPALTRVVPYLAVMVLLLVASVYGILAPMVRDAIRGDAEARTLLGGVFVATVLFAGQTAGQAMPVPNAALERVFSHGAEIGHVFYAFAIALALANRFGRSLDALDLAHGRLKATYEAAARFVPTDLLQILGHESIREVHLGDQVAMPMSTLFCDLRGFSALAETLGPAQTFEVINEYLSFMEPAIHAHRGLILQYLGDGIMALFPGRAEDAVRAGIAMHIALGRFNEARAAQSASPLSFGIGINTGGVMVGTIGGHDRLSCGVVGDAVNLASRIEGMTKQYGVSFLLGEQTVEAIGDRAVFGLREIDRVVAKGTTRGQSIYEVIDVLPAAARALRVESSERYAAALVDLKAGRFDRARTTFEAIVAGDPTDCPAALLCERSAELAAAPPSGWTGETALATK